MSMATNTRACPTCGWNFGVIPHTYIRSTPSGCRGTISSSRPVSVEYIRTDIRAIIGEDVSGHTARTLEYFPRGDPQVRWPADKGGRALRGYRGADSWTT